MLLICKIIKIIVICNLIWNLMNRAIIRQILSMSCSIIKKKKGDSEVSLEIPTLIVSIDTVSGCNSLLIPSNSFVFSNIRRTKHCSKLTELPFGKAQSLILSYVLPPSLSFCCYFFLNISQIQISRHSSLLFFSRQSE